MRTITATTLLLLAGCADSGSEAGAPKEGMVSWNTPVDLSANQQSDAQGSTLSAASLTTSQEPETVNELGDPPVVQRSNGCDRMFVAGVRPVITNATLKANADKAWDEVCYRAYSAGHAGVYRVPLWSAEIVDPTTTELASRLSRDSRFREDTSIPESRRAVDDDYRHSGYDRGHLAPSADMPSMEAQAESFYFTNIVPQNGSLNGGDWVDLEKQVRRQGRKGKVYVVTGPIVQYSRKSLKSRVIVPTHLYKALYAVGKGAVVFVAENKAKGKWQNLSVEQFAGVYGIDPFPALPARVKRHNIAIGPLPPPPSAEGDDATTSSSGRIEADTSATVSNSRARLYGEQGTGPWMTTDEFIKKYGRSARVDEIRY